jgi:hypothetical protein
MSDNDPKFGQADRPPTEDEERAAEEITLDPDVAESYEEAARRGADLEGEGEIEGVRRNGSDT